MSPANPRVFYQHQFRKRRQSRKRRVAPKPEVTIAQILAWADAYHQACGRWPKQKSGRIPGSLGETWSIVDEALRYGRRGLPCGSSLARLLAAERGVRNIHDLPPLSGEQILAWADEFRERTGEWPTSDSGPIAGAPGEKWQNIDVYLRSGCRGLPGGSSLAQLLTEQRSVSNHMAMPPLSEEQILVWADAHYGRTGAWPNVNSGPIAGADNQTWRNVDSYLRTGNRGLPGGSSLAQLLAEQREFRNIRDLPPFTVTQILHWADAHHERAGEWPNRESGPISESPQETWSKIDNALKTGQRGLPGNSSLRQLLAQRRGIRNHKVLPTLTIAQILAWADAHFRRTGEWPTRTGGAIAEAPGETWSIVDTALGRGRRGLPSGSSLARLLNKHRGVRNPACPPRLSVAGILNWADAHHQRTGAWPSASSGPIPDAPGETWTAVDLALQRGTRGLRGGSSLAKLLASKRGTRNRKALPKLTIRKILRWADAHHKRTGAWPNRHTGPIADAPGETWMAIDSALWQGLRGLPSRVTLHQVLLAHGRKSGKKSGKRR